MVEEARDIRDRGYLAINLLLGAVALAVGAFDMFALRSFTATSIFDALLGMSMILVGVLFIAPYMAPSAVGLPGPGVRMVRRPYLPYPVPIPVAEGGADLAEGETPPELGPESTFVEEVPAVPHAPVRAPGVAAGVAGAPKATMATSSAVATADSGEADWGFPELDESRLASSAEAEEAISSLEALGTSRSQGPVEAQEPLPRLPPRLSVQPPPAEYLEEAEPPEAHPAPVLDHYLEPQLQKALDDLAGVAAQETNGAHRLQLVNGKPPERTLSDLEDVLRQGPKGATAAGTPSAAAQAPAASSVVARSAIEEVDHLELELESMPRVDQAPPPSTPSSLTKPPNPPVERASVDMPADGAPPAPSPAPAPAAGSPPSPPGGPKPQVPEKDSLDAMADALETMVSGLKAESVPPDLALSAQVSSRAPAPAPREELAEEEEAPPAIEELERQLATMRSALLQEAPRSLPPAPDATANGKGRKGATLPAGGGLPPSPAVDREPHETSEEDLQKMLEDVQSAVKETEERFEPPSRNGKKRKR